jgi:hypothetical protein
MIFSRAAKVTGFAQGSTLRACWLALSVLFCVTTSCEGTYAMNDRPDSSRPQFMQVADVQWWSPTVPHGEEFELPSGTKSCSVLKVRFVGQIIMIAARVGPTYPSEASFLVEDNFGDQQYGSGKVIKSLFYQRYNDIDFFSSEINRKLGSQSVWFQDRNDANLVLVFGVGKRQPENAVYVCAFKEGEQVFLSYFLKRSPPRPWYSPQK